MPIVVRAFRTTYIWHEANLALWYGPTAAAAPYAFLAQHSTYIPAFEDLLKKAASGDEPASGLAPPWPREGQRFWYYYLEQRDLNTLEGKYAWKGLVPLRMRGHARLTGTGADPGGPSLEGYLYPFGLALMATFRHDKLTSPLQEAAERAIQARWDTYTTTWTGGDSESLTLDQFAGKALERMRAAAFSSGAPAGRRFFADPFTVFTLTSAEGADTHALPPAGGDVHKALAALTGVQGAFKDATLGELKPPFCLTLRSRSPQSHVVYARPRGRAVWFPSLFSAATGGGDQPLKSLGAYHRNMVFASMQVEALCGLTLESNERRHHGALAAAHRQAADLASGLLGRMYGGKGTYRNWGARAFIDQNDLVLHINEARAEHVPALPSLA